MNSFLWGYEMRHSLANKDFLILWITQGISQIANAFHLIALPLWIYTITGSSVQTGLVTVLEIIPALIIGLYAGVITDRYNRKYIFLITDLSRALLVLSLLLVPMFDAVWIVYVVAVCTGITSSFSVPAQSAIIQSIVQKKYLSDANSLLMLSTSFSLIIGPGIGGMIVEAAGYESTFIINSISFIIGAIGSLLIKIPKVSIDNFSMKNDRSIFIDLQEGYKIIKNSNNISRTLLTMFIVFFGIGANGILFILHLKSKGLTAQEIGLFMSSQGVGMIIGSFSYSRITKKINNFLYFNLMAILILGITLIIFIQTSASSFYLGIISIMFFGLALSYFNISSRTILQTNTPESSMGRVTGVSRIINTSASSLSILIGSFLSSIIYPSVIVTIFGVFIIISCFALLLKPKIISIKEVGETKVNH